MSNSKQERVTHEEFGQFLSCFYKSPGHLRLGQAMCNEFSLGPDPELFYERDENKAIDMFTERYLVKE